MSVDDAGMLAVDGGERTADTRVGADDAGGRTRGARARAAGPRTGASDRGGTGSPAGLIADRLRALAAGRPDATAVVDVAVSGDDRALTWRELDRAVDQMAAFLLRLGVRPGEPVCYQLPNWSEFVVISLAAARTGAICCPLMPFFREREVAFVLERSRARVLFVPQEFRGRDYPVMVSSLDSPGALEHVVVVRGGPGSDHVAARTAEAGSPAAPRGLRWHRLEGALRDLTAEAVSGSDKGSARNEVAAPDERPSGTEGPAPARGLAPDVAAVRTRRRSLSDDPVLEAFAQLLFTSGTSGEPKGVLHRHATLDRAVEMHIRHFGLTPADTVYIPSPLAHQTGFLYGMWLAIHLGAPQVLQDVWDAGVGLEVLRRWNVGFVQAATPFLADLVGAVIGGAAAPRRLRFFVATGATVPRALALDATRVLGTRVCGGWGSTESCMGTAGGPGDPPDKAWSTDGRPLDGIQVRIGDGRGSALPPETEGEFELHTPLMFAGYLDHPEWTADAYTPDGWYRTGDLAVLDHDGYIRITGRIKDVINRGGEKIPVAEVEQVLYEHPAVQEVAIVAMPDRRLGERACAFIVPRPGATLDFEALCRYLDGRNMARQYWPERLEIVGALPYTPSGKIQKYRLRERAAGLVPVVEKGAVHGPGAAPEPGAAAGPVPVVEKGAVHGQGAAPEPGAASGPGAAFEPGAAADRIHKPEAQA